MHQYLKPTAIIDFDNPAVQVKAKALRGNSADDCEVARRCFEFVRDEIKHSWDHKLNPVTYKASDVLRHGTGYCFAKSHLLAALLRANSIPSGLCYQRLAMPGDVPSFCLHGLNAVYLKKFGWYRVDARGNKEGVNATFSPPRECLAFPICAEGEADCRKIWADPLPEVMHVLQRSETYLDVANNLPDTEAVI
ncbi:hypothetical protein Maes01_02494 [Microbulbifer aestuariivivens]|uniref:Transglutaminase-like domain-containing protein n=1 Tax=Microbulbifer aestuariivivens TaxID=1908308 RepID=A0ABP9WRT2_9GAMM